MSSSLPARSSLPAGSRGCQRVATGITDDVGVRRHREVRGTPLELLEQPDWRQAVTTRTAHALVSVATVNRKGVRLALLGGLLGIAWAAGLRGFMAQIARDESHVGWSGTFCFVLLPGLLIGLLLGWAEYLRTTGGRRGWRWLAVSPLLFAGILFSNGPLAVLGVFKDGIGGGALAVPLYAMAGGYAISGRGPRWSRIACGALALSVSPIWALTVESFAGPTLAVTTPRGLWVALYFYSFLAVFTLAAAIPHRRVTSG